MKSINKEKLILASKSPRRKDLLEQAGIQIKVVPSNIDESDMNISSPVEYVKELAYLKAKKITEEYSKNWVLGGDTIVVVNDQILGKPKSRSDAVKMLTLLNNTVHSVFTAFCIINEQASVSVLKSIETKVYFKALSAEEINWYAGTEEPYDKAGGYGIQGIGAFMVKKISGSYSNVVGLPVSDVVDALIELNIVEF